MAKRASDRHYNLEIAISRGTEIALDYDTGTANVCGDQLPTLSRQISIRVIVKEMQELLCTIGGK
jgi:hypothetical protein